VEEKWRCGLARRSTDGRSESKEKNVCFVLLKVIKTYRRCPKAVCCANVGP
jgi:hypothetical protein